ncbi:MAG: hypothetical protein J6331_08690 [Lentisphaeria bacterium]|nr:hypothetical protein [Lentisphaeria bacterium]
MIPIQPIHIFSAFIAVLFLVLFIAWLHSEFKHKPDYDWSAVRENLYHCDNCHISFLACNEKGNFARCPGCGEYCFIGKKRRI